MASARDHVRVDLMIEDVHRARRHLLAGVAVDADNMLTWLPAHVLESMDIKPKKICLLRRTDGTVFERWAGAAILGIGDRRTVGDVIFAEPGDLAYIGWRVLSGLNLRIEPTTSTLVDRGPIPAAVAA